MNLFEDTNNMIKKLLDVTMQQLTVTNEVAYLEDLSLIHI